MSVSILGENIRLFRPTLINRSLIKKCDLPRPKYNTRSRTIKEHTGKVKAICIKLINETILSLERGTHADVVIEHSVKLEEVKCSGWLLENGNYVWR